MFIYPINVSIVLFSGILREGKKKSILELLQMFMSSGKYWKILLSERQRKKEQEVPDSLGNLNRHT